MSKSKKRVVVMGGGTGIYPVVSAIKSLGVDLTAIVAASDSGGSTGRIRDEFGFPAVGDLRQSLAAMAQDEGEDWIRKILLYRFEKGKGLEGHNLGNLLLTALQDMTGSTTKALAIAEKIFRISGEVIPVTEQSAELEITYQDGSTVVGEHTLDTNLHKNKVIDSVKLIPNNAANPAAISAIKRANLVIIGPGDYYASLMAVLVADGIKAAFTKSQAQTLYIVNLMTRSTQTANMSAADHVSGIEAVIGKNIDHIILNSESIPESILEMYAAEDEYPVVDDLTTDTRAIRKPLLEEMAYEKSELDTAHRSFLRHNQEKLQTVLTRYL